MGQYNDGADTCCLALALLLLIGTFFACMPMVYEYLFFTHLEVYGGYHSANVPQDLETFDIPIRYKPNSNVHVIAVYKSSNINIHDTIKTNDDGLAIYTANISAVNEDITFAFTVDDSDDDRQHFTIFKSPYYTECTVQSGEDGSYDYMTGDDSEIVSPHLKIED